MKYQKGYTIIELLICIAFLAVLAVIGGGLYVLIHFVGKFW